MEGKQIDHQSHVIEVASKIGNKNVSILIDTGASNTYSAPSIVLDCSLKKRNLEVPSIKYS